MINDVFLNRVIDLKSKIDKEKCFNSGMEAGAKNQKQEISSVINMTIFDVENVIKEYELRKKSGVNVIPVNI